MQPKNQKQQKQERPDESISRRAPDDPSRAPEKEGSATQTKSKGQLFERASGGRIRRAG